MLCGSESCIKRIKTFKSKRPKNRLALKKSLLQFLLIKLKKYIWGKTDIIVTFVIKEVYQSMRVFSLELVYKLIRPQSDFELQNICGYMIILRQASGL